MDLAHRLLNRIVLLCLAFVCWGGANAQRVMRHRVTGNLPTVWVALSASIATRYSRRMAARFLRLRCMNGRETDCAAAMKTSSSQGEAIRGETSTVSYSDSLLVIHYKDRTGRDKSIDMNLKFDPGDGHWSGGFHRGTLGENVVLKRVPKHPLVLEACILRLMAIPKRASHRLADISYSEPARVPTTLQHARGGPRSQKQSMAS